MHTKTKLNQPLSGNEAPRFAGPATFMRLPTQKLATDLDVGFIGVPFDIGTSNRPGARLAPREIRDESRLLRPCNVATDVAPFDSLQVADIGDVPINTYNVSKSIAIIERFYDDVYGHECMPISLGGDHTIVLPILRAAAKKHGPLAMVHVDAHADSNDSMFGEAYTHGTPFRRAVEEELIDPNRVVQIGLRGSGYSADEFQWGREQGFRIVEAHECWYKSLTPLMKEVASHLSGRPVYLSFDVDGLDPSFAPGTGTPEPGGLTSIQGLEVVRGCAGLNVIGADVVEVCPPFDLSHNTSLLAANLAFEMLCIHPALHTEG